MTILAVAPAVLQSPFLTISRRALTAQPPTSDRPFPKGVYNLGVSDIAERRNLAAHFTCFVGGKPVSADRRYKRYD